MRLLLKIGLGVFLIATLLGAFASNSVFAANLSLNASSSVQPMALVGEGLDVSGLPDVKADQSTLEKILKIVFATIGAISVLVVAYGGFKYVISQGNPQETAKAKDTILYAMIGLAVAIFASVIVSFVASKL